MTIFGRENSSIYSKQFNDLKIKRRYNKRIAYALGYRFINRKDEELNFSNQNRFYSDLSYRKKIIKRLSFSLRNRLQLQGYLNSYSNTFRQKFALSYNIRKTKLTPNIATEYFIDSDVILNKLRSTVGINTSWISPAGPLSFIFSKNITKASTDVDQTFNFRLGTTF